jgi:hypothetical protein
MVAASGRSMLSLIASSFVGLARRARAGAPSRSYYLSGRRSTRSPPLALYAVR